MSGENSIGVPAMTYDQKCFDLAEWFIGSGENGSAAKIRCEYLAEKIQQTIEDWECDNPLNNFMEQHRALR